jgi:hypothetical protein
MGPAFHTGAFLCNFKLNFPVFRDMNQDVGFLGIDDSLLRKRAGQLAYAASDTNSGFHSYMYSFCGFIRISRCLTGLPDQHGFFFLPCFLG